MIALQEKELSQKRKFKNALAKHLVISPEKRGYTVWKRLNDQLYTPSGITSLDQLRINEFRKLIKKISFLDYYALRWWLKRNYSEIEQEAYGLTNATLEQHCTKWMQIYSEHYNAME